MSKLFRKRSNNHRVDFNIEVLSQAGPNAPVIPPGTLLRVQLSRKSGDYSSGSATYLPAKPAVWISEIGSITVSACTLHFSKSGKGFLEKPFTVELLRTTPPLTAGKKW